MNRLEGISGEFTNGPDYNMQLMLSYLTEPELVPQANKYYVFVYKAKTPNIQYDQHPLILCGNVFKWGFTGYNFHWNAIRQYSWAEVKSNLYELTEDEFEIAKDVRIAKFKNS
jgi:hypothetical protein